MTTASIGTIVKDSVNGELGMVIAPDLALFMNSNLQKLDEKMSVYDDEQSLDELIGLVRGAKNQLDAYENSLRIKHDNVNAVMTGDEATIIAELKKY